MNVMILATKGCTHCRNLSRELDDLGIEHEMRFCDDEPELVKKYNIRHSPNLIVDDEVVFREQPTERELKEFFKL